MTISKYLDSIEKLRDRRMIQVLIWILRITIGATFIISGFVKGIDPWGTLYKLEEYLGVMHISVIPSILIVATFTLCAYEFIVGIFLLLGCFRRSAPIFGLIFMSVMLPLTLWIAIKNPVADCGCFGDAIILGNTATFWKNVALTAGIIVLLIFNRKCIPLISPAIQWIAMVSSVGYILCISFIGYQYQPLIDFRPYKIGQPLTAGTEHDSEENEISFVYSKNGEERVFSIDEDMPDEESGWKFIRREYSASGSTPESADSKESLSKDSDKRNFRIWNEDGEDDLTEDVLDKESERLLLLMPALKDVSIATTWQINSLYSWANDHDIDFIGIVSGTPRDIEIWKDLSLAEYPIYTAEDTEIKMVARGNPAVVYLENGIVGWKSSLKALGISDFQASGSSSDPHSLARDNKVILYNISGVYLILMALLIGISIFRYGIFHNNISHITHDDMEVH